MKQTILGTLYADPQDQKPACRCPECGGLCYAPSLCCIRCLRDKP